VFFFFLNQVYRAKKIKLNSTKKTNKNQTRN